MTTGGVWTNHSSGQAKENIADLTSEEALAVLAGLEPVLFNYKVDAEDQYIGFDARRPPANLIFAIVEIAALLVIFFGPKNDVALFLAFAVYGAALSGLIASIGGLFGVDIAPRGATGAAMGFVGVFSYLGAATQENVSASLITQGITLIDGVRVYDFDIAIYFWIGTSVVSMLLAATLWNTKTRD